MDPQRILELIEVVRRDGYACSSQECCPGGLTVAAPVIGEGSLPIGVISVSAPTRRRTLDSMRAKLASLVVETARAVSGRTVPRAQG